MKTCSTSVVIREMPMKLTRNHLITPENFPITSTVGDDMETDKQEW